MFFLLRVIFRHGKEKHHFIKGFFFASSLFYKNKKFISIFYELFILYCW